MNAPPPRHRGIASAVLLATCTCAGTAAAQPSSASDAIVLRRDATQGPEAAEIEQALVAELAERAGFADVQTSSTSMSRLALAAGCTDDVAECGGRIARTVSAAVVVWSVGTSEDGPRLVLEVFEADGPPTVVSVRGRGRTAVERAVARLSRERGSEVPRAGPPPATPLWRASEPQPTAPPPAPLVMLGVGTGALAGGIALAASVDGGDDGGGSPRARGAYAMLSLGSALLAAGGALLAVELTKGEGSALTAGVSAGEGVAVAWLQGSVAP